MWERCLGEKWKLRQAMECQACKTERSRRCCVIYDTDDSSQRYTKDPFGDAPFVHPFRHPAYHAQQLRSLNFAKAKNRRLLWITAHDVIKKSDAAMTKDKEELRKEQWLRFHDRFTNGIPGLLPLVLDLPIRFTDSPNKDAKEMGVYKHSRGWLRGWELTATEQQRLDELLEPEVVLLEKRCDCT